jgi:uncharacterized protein YbaR (Trm112 family)
MNTLEMLKIWQINCPACKGELKIKAELHDSQHKRPDGCIEERTTITPVFECKNCHREYVPSITLNERIKNIKIKCTL